MIPRCIRSFSTKSAQRDKALSSFLGLSKNTYATEATFETKPFRLHKLESGPAQTVQVTKKDALDYYAQMTTIRRMETAAGNMYKEKIIRGFCHLYSGQEACAVGIKAAMRPQDAVIGGYRAHGWTYLMGVSEFGVMAELAGRKSGCVRGKGGSIHMYAKNIYGGVCIVGSQIPQGVGIAFALKYNGTDGICFTVYGDGAANQGQVFEAFNMAKLWNVPCIFVCENNGYGMGTSAARSSANTDYYTRGDYIPGIWIDGMDVLAVREATRYAVNHCTSGKGPIILETATYRYGGHSMSDPGTTYRTREEIKEVRQSRDPITSFQERLISSGLAETDEIKKLEGQIRARVDDAVKKAKADPEVGLEELVADVYANPIEPTVRGITPWDKLKHISVGKPLNL